MDLRFFVKRAIVKGVEKFMPTPWVKHNKTCGLMFDEGTDVKRGDIVIGKKNESSDSSEQTKE